MDVIFNTTFRTLKGILYVVIIYDRDDDTGELFDVLLADNGFELDVNANWTDVVKGGFIETSVSLRLVSQGSQGFQNLVNFTKQLAQSPEGRYLIEIKSKTPLQHTYQPYWRGLLLQDFIPVEDSSKISISITAVDGLSLMKKYKVSTTNNTNPLLFYILDGLQYIPTFELWNPVMDNKFLHIRTDWYSGQMIWEPGATLPKEPLSQALFRGNSVWVKQTEVKGYNGIVLKKKEPMTYYEVIQHVLERFNAVLLMREGAWYLYQLDLVELGEQDILFQTYRARPWFVGSNWQGFPPIIQKRIYAFVPGNQDTSWKRWRGGCEFNRIPALKKVSVTYAGGNLEDGFDSIVPAGFIPGQTYTTIPITGGAGNYLHVRISFKEYFVVNYPGATLPQKPMIAYIKYRVKIKQGDHMLFASGNWVLGNTTGFQLVSSTHIKNEYDEAVGLYVLKDWVDVYFDLLTQPLPLTFTELEVRIEREGVVLYDPEEVGFSVNINDHFNFTPDLQNHFILYIVNNETPVSSITFEATNSEERFWNEYELQPSLFGTAPVVQNNVFTSTYYGGAGVIEKWRKGWGSTDVYYFNELLVREMLKLQSKNLLFMKGNIYDRNSEEVTAAWNGVSINFDPNTFFDNYILLPNKVTYFARREELQGDWIEVKSIELKPPINPVVITPIHINVPTPLQTITPLSNTTRGIAIDDYTLLYFEGMLEKGVGVSGNSTYLDAGEGVNWNINEWVNKVVGLSNSNGMVDYVLVKENGKNVLYFETPSIFTDMQGVDFKILHTYEIEHLNINHCFKLTGQGEGAILLPKTEDTSLYTNYSFKMGDDMSYPVVLYTKKSDKIHYSKWGFLLKPYESVGLVKVSEGQWCVKSTYLIKKRATLYWITSEIITNVTWDIVGDLMYVMSENLLRFNEAMFKGKRVLRYISPVASYFTCSGQLIVQKIKNTAANVFFTLGLIREGQTYYLSQFATQARLGTQAVLTIPFTISIELQFNDMIFLAAYKTADTCTILEGSNLVIGEN